MSRNTKHTNKMQKHFRICVKQNNGGHKEILSRSGIKDIYMIGDKKVAHKWHTSPSSSNIVKLKKSDLNRMSKTLGIESDWKKFKNENTIYMQNNLIGDLM